MIVNWYHILIKSYGFIHFQNLYINQQRLWLGASYDLSMNLCSSAERPSNDEHLPDCTQILGLKHTLSLKKFPGMSTRSTRTPQDLY